METRLLMQRLRYFNSNTRSQMKKLSAEMLMKEAKPIVLEKYESVSGFIKININFLAFWAIKIPMQRSTLMIFLLNSLPQA